MTSELRIGGMSCASCVRRVETALRHVPGVKNATVNFATETATVDSAEDVPRELLIEAVETAGYKAEEYPRTRPPKNASNLWLAIALSAPTLVISMASTPKSQWENFLLFALSTPVVFWCGRQFFVNAASALIHFDATMDTLISLGAGT